MENINYLWVKLCRVMHNTSAVQMNVRNFDNLINYAPRHEDIWDSKTLPFLALALDGGKWSTSYPAASMPGKEPLAPIIQGPEII
jgi:hypothetical protein